MKTRTVGILLLLSSLCVGTTVILFSSVALIYRIRNKGIEGFFDFDEWTTSQESKTSAASKEETSYDLTVGKTLKYGLYPQKAITDSPTVNAVLSAAKTKRGEYQTVEMNGKYYANINDTVYLYEPVEWTIVYQGEEAGKPQWFCFSNIILESYYYGNETLLPSDYYSSEEGNSQFIKDCFFADDALSVSYSCLPTNTMIDGTDNMFSLEQYVIAFQRTSFAAQKAHILAHDHVCDNVSEGYFLWDIQDNQAMLFDIEGGKKTLEGNNIPVIAGIRPLIALTAK